MEYFLAHNGKKSISGEGCDFSKNFDWIVLRSGNIIKNNKIPKTIYCDVHALNYFSDNILENLTSKFTIITGCGDHIPQIHYQKAFNKIYNYKFLDVWYMENMAFEMERCKSLPVGLGSHTINDEQLLIALMSNNKKIKKNKVFICCYSRFGDDEIFNKVGCNIRSKYKEYASKHPEVFDVFEEGISLEKFLKNLIEYNFSCCPHGYGLDPNPTAWYSLALGVTPIVHNTANSRSMFSDIKESIIYVDKPEDIPEKISKKPICSNDFLTAKYWANKILSHNI